MGNWNPDTNINTPNFVDMHNTQQHVPQEFVDTHIVKDNKEETTEQKSVRENLVMAARFKSWSVMLNTIAKGLLEESFTAATEDYTKEMEQSAVEMLNAWEEFSKSISSVAGAHDNLVNNYTEEVYKTITNGVKLKEDVNSTGSQS